eukprot:jgi/Chlat1/1981/Chrsp158S02279
MDSDGEGVKELWVGNIDSRATEFDLFRFLDEYAVGMVDCRLFPRTSPITYAFLTMKDCQAAARLFARADAHPLMFMGRRLSVRMKRCFVPSTRGGSAGPSTSKPAAGLEKLKLDIYDVLRASPEPLELSKLQSAFAAHHGRQLDTTALGTLSQVVTRLLPDEVHIAHVWKRVGREATWVENVVVLNGPEVPSHWQVYSRGQVEAAQRSLFKELKKELDSGRHYLSLPASSADDGNGPDIASWWDFLCRHSYQTMRFERGRIVLDRKGPSALTELEQEERQQRQDSKRKRITDRLAFPEGQQMAREEEPCRNTRSDLMHRTEHSDAGASGQPDSKRKKKEIMLRLSFPEELRREPKKKSVLDRLQLPPMLPKLSPVPEPPRIVDPSPSSSQWALQVSAAKLSPTECADMFLETFAVHPQQVRFDRDQAGPSDQFAYARAERRHEGGTRSNRAASPHGNEASDDQTIEYDALGNSQATTDGLYMAVDQPAKSDQAKTGLVTTEYATNPIPGNGSTEQHRRPDCAVPAVHAQAIIVNAGVDVVQQPQPQPVAMKQADDEVEEGEIVSDNMVPAPRSNNHHTSMGQQHKSPLVSSNVKAEDDGTALKKGISYNPLPVIHAPAGSKPPQPTLSVSEGESFLPLSTSQMAVQPLKPSRRIKIRLEGCKEVTTVNAAAISSVPELLTTVSARFAALGVKVPPVSEQTLLYVDQDDDMNIAAPDETWEEIVERAKQIIVRMKATAAS